MKKFLVVDRQACVVEWRFPVEAETSDEALTKYANGEHGEAIGQPVIGDSIDDFQYDLEVEAETV